MGFKDKLKKKAENKENSEEIGGMLADSALPLRTVEGAAATASAAPAAPFAQGFPTPPVPEVQDPPTDSKMDGLSSLDLFADETAEDQDEKKLWDMLPVIDVQDLLTECQEIADQLKQIRE